MNERSKKVGDFIKNTLYYAKCIELLIQNHKLTLNGGLRFEDKNLANSAINKIDSAINDITKIVKKEDIRKLIIKDVVEKDFSNQMTLIQLLFTLEDETLTEVVDVVEEYLKNKAIREDKI